MIEQPILKSKLRTFNLLTNTGIALGLCVLIGYIYFNSIGGSVANIINSVFTVAIVGIIIYHIKVLLKMDSLAVYKNKVEIKSMLSNDRHFIFLSEITSWTENIMKDHRIARLSLFTGQKTYVIDSDVYNNYYELKELITANAHHDLEIENNIYYRLHLKKILFYT